MAKTTGNITKLNLANYLHTNIEGNFLLLLFRCWHREHKQNDSVKQEYHSNMYPISHFKCVHRSQTTWNETILFICRFFTWTKTHTERFRYSVIYFDSTLIHLWIMLRRIGALFKFSHTSYRTGFIYYDKIYQTKIIPNQLVYFNHYRSRIMMAGIVSIEVV